jgi:hypothetical protein
MKRSEAMTTRTVNVLAAEVADYIEYLASEAWPVVRVREVEGGRYLAITFAVGA